MSMYGWITTCWATTLPRERMGVVPLMRHTGLISWDRVNLNLLRVTRQRL